MRKKSITRADTSWHYRAKSFWYKIQKEYALTTDQEEILAVCCGALSRLHEATEILNREGLCFATKSGCVKKHPGNEIEKQSRGQFLQGMKLLGIDISDDATRSHPGRPTVHGI